LPITEEEEDTLWSKKVLGDELWIVSQGRIQDFKLGGAHLKRNALSGGRREKFWGISCEKSRFYAKKNHIFSILRGRAKYLGYFMF
jgi:hypothetical protein